MIQNTEKKFKETTVKLAKKIAETIGLSEMKENDNKVNSNKKESTLYKLKKEIDNK